MKKTKPNVFYLNGQLAEGPPKSTSYKRVISKLSENPNHGMFAMTWDKNGKVEYHTTHLGKERHFIRSHLMYFINETI
jgi:hypothetical protein